MALSRAACSIVLMSLVMAALAAQPSGSVYLEELTWTEVRGALKAGKTTIIIPVGGTEQYGPHMALGKHNVRVKVLAGRIAQTLGTALVAPVVNYVPEGSVAPPLGHMRFAGTISVPDTAFKAVLDGAARSFKQHGFVDVVLIGDSGNYQNQLRDVAAQLNRAWSSTPARAHYIADYYRATQTRYPQLLRGKGLNEAQIGTHAGAADTSLLMAIDASMVRPDNFEAATQGGTSAGVEGDPRPSSAALGQLGVDLILEHAVSAIRQAVASRR